MPFREPVSTLGGHQRWKNIEQNEYFLLQKHKTGKWSYKYRILVRANSKEIVNAEDFETINWDWEFLSIMPFLEQMKKEC